MDDEDTDTHLGTFESIGVAVSKLLRRIKRQRANAAELGEGPDAETPGKVSEQWEEKAHDRPIRADGFERTNFVSGEVHHHTPANLNIPAHARQEATQAIVYDARGIMPRLSVLAGRERR